MITVNSQIKVERGRLGILWTETKSAEAYFVPARRTSLYFVDGEFHSRSTIYGHLITSDIWYQKGLK